MDDKEKSAIDKLMDVVTGETVKSAVVPTQDTEAEAVDEKTNEQMFLGDAAIAPEAAPALIAPKKTAAKKRRAAPKKSAKQVAQPVAKTPKKTAKKAAKKTAKKTKSSAGRKAVGKNKTAKKVAKKKKAKTKSRR